MFGRMTAIPLVRLDTGKDLEVVQFAVAALYERRNWILNDFRRS